MNEFNKVIISDKNNNNPKHANMCGWMQYPPPTQIIPP